MSLSSFLLTKAKAQDTRAVDTELDALFKSKAHAAPPAKTQDEKGKKRRLSDEDAVVVKGKKPRKESRRTTVEDDGGEEENSPTDRESPEGDSEHTDEEEEVEHAPDRDSSESGSEEDEEDAEPSNLVHESLQGKKSKPKVQSKRSKKKYVPPDETPAQRDLRTVFVGNLSVEVAKKRPLQKQLRRHLLSAVPSAKIESVRFRSIAFQSPTAKLPDTPDKTHSKESKENKEKEAREHDRTRAAAWREEQDAKESKDEKKFLTANQKKRIAFINQEFHSVADTVHAYVVFAHPIPPTSSEGKESMDPYDAASIAARQCDGTMFMDRLLRVDVVGKSSSTAHATGADPKLTIFVGNLDFASKEEDLRVFFEGVVTKERGPPSQPQEEGEEEDSDEEDEEEGSVKPGQNAKARTWVTRVRIVRDRETQLGKGFAYVQFADRECVDELLALEEGQLKFAKRKLRVQRCKTIPGSSVSTKHLTADTNKKANTQPQSKSSSAAQTKKPITKSVKQGQAVTPPVPIVVPKGNPKLGEKLVHLSKDERKRAKAADADRVARRLAKKKARMAMGTKDKDQAGDGKNDGKKRVRVRKNTKDNARSAAKAGKGKEKKGRVRSEKALAKLNTKK